MNTNSRFLRKVVDCGPRPLHGLAGHDGLGAVDPAGLDIAGEAAEDRCGISVSFCPTGPAWPSEHTRTTAAPPPPVTCGS